MATAEEMMTKAAEAYRRGSVYLDDPNGFTSLDLEVANIYFAKSTALSAMAQSLRVEETNRILERAVRRLNQLS